MTVSSVAGLFNLRWFVKIADYLRGRRGFWRYFLAILFGIICAYAYPPIDIIPLLWLGFLVLIFLLQGAQSAWQAFAISWSFAFSFFIFNLYWVVGAMFVDIQKFWWEGIVAGVGLPTVLALVYGICLSFAYKIGLRGLRGIMTFALMWFISGYLRGHLFSGFPWDIEGYVWADCLPPLQLASLVGVYGLTLITIILVSLPAVFADPMASRRGQFAAIGVYVLFGIGCLWGAGRASSAPHETVPDVRLRLVLPAIGQEIKVADDMRVVVFNDLLKLSQAPAEKPLTAIIWPEGSAQFLLAEDAEHRQLVAAAAPPNGSVITGLLRRETSKEGQMRVFNSMIAVDHAGNVQATYDKVHLLPFGEFSPLSRYTKLKALATNGIDLSEGPGPRTWRVKGVPPFSPLICYEVIFSNDVIDRSDPPQFLLNISNDGWFEKTTGPYQHFANAKTRGVEEGLPLVRVADAGVSGIVDAYGRTQLQLSMEKMGFVDGDLPKPIAGGTVFSHYRETILWGAVILLAAAILISRRPRKVQ